MRRLFWSRRLGGTEPSLRIQLRLEITFLAVDQQGSGTFSSVHNAPATTVISSEGSVRTPALITSSVTYCKRSAILDIFRAE